MEHKAKRSKRTHVANVPSVGSSSGSLNELPPSASGTSTTTAESHGSISGSSLPEERYSFRKRNPIPESTGDSSTRCLGKHKRGPSGGARSSRTRILRSKSSSSSSKRKGKQRATEDPGSSNDDEKTHTTKSTSTSSKGKTPRRNARATPLENAIHQDSDGHRALRELKTEPQLPEVTSQQDTESEESDDEEGNDPVSFFKSATAMAPVTLDNYEDLFRMSEVFGLRDMTTHFNHLLEELNENGVQLSTLQELSEVLSVSNEDNLSGNVPCRDLVATLLGVLNGPQEANLLAMLADDPNAELLTASSLYQGQSTEKMVLACQCISNLLDALPSSAAAIVAHNGVQVLCQKLEPSDYIDLQEQALYALEKIAASFPREVVRGGGLDAALKHFHFFTIHYQRSALQTAAHCMLGIDLTGDILPHIRNAIDTLADTLSYPDLTVVDLTCLCWARLVDSCGSNRERLEEIIDHSRLRKMVDLIPVPSNASVRATSFGHLLRVFRGISTFSPKLSCQLLELGIANRFYQIVTGVTVADDGGTPSELGSLTIDTKWRDSVYPIMKIIVDLLPPLPEDELLSSDRFHNFEPIALRTRSSRTTSSNGTPSHLTKQHSNHSEDSREHVAILNRSPGLIRQVGSVLIPLLTGIYASMVNLALRELVTNALVKLIYYCDSDILRDIIKDIPISAFLVEILAQRSHEALVIYALYQAELLVTKLPDIFYELFEIEGVLHEINVLAELPLDDSGPYDEDESMEIPDNHHYQQRQSLLHSERGIGQGSTRRYVVLLAQNVIRIYRNQTPMILQDLNSTSESRNRLIDLQSISSDLRGKNGHQALAQFLGIVSRTSIGISSFELSHSGILDALVWYLTHKDNNFSSRRKAFSNIFLTNQEPQAKALRTLVDRLQISLGRSEQFQIITPAEGSDDEFRNTSSMLHRQIRVRLSGEGSLDGRVYTVLVPAVARFKVLEDYLLSRVGHLCSPLSPGRTSIDELEYSDDESICDPDVISSLDHGQETDDDDNDDDPMNIDEDTLPRVKETHAEQQRAHGDRGRPSRRRVQFFSKGRTVDTEMTVYGAIHRNEDRPRGIWTSTYMFTYKLVRSSDEEVNNESPIPETGCVTSTPNSTCTKVLRLLAAIYDLAQENDHYTIDFTNRKLTGKMQRQLEEFLIIASGCLPDWADWLMREYHFLFPFETRYQFLQSTAYGYTRLVARWQSLQMRGNQPRASMDDNNQLQHRHQQPAQPLFHQLTRHKIKIPRENMLVSATKILDHFGSSHSALEIQYTGEEGTGLGPTLEFYSVASKEFRKRSHQMWRDNDDDGEYVSASSGLFPLAMIGSSQEREKTLKLFETLGQFVAKAMVDFRMIDMPFSPAFFKVMFGIETTQPLRLLKDIDPVLRNSLGDLQADVDRKREVLSDTSLSAVKRSAALSAMESRLENLCLDFTLPGHPEVMLKENGENIAVTIDNVDEYLERLLDMVIGTGIAKQMRMFSKGFNKVFDLDRLRILTPSELVSLFGNSVEDWSYSTIASAIHADHGFTTGSRTVQNLVCILSEMSQRERRDFLQFATGSPRLPIGGWHALRPVFTVVRKQCEPPLGPDDYLPSVMTCANYFKLPEYSTKEVLLQRLLKSMHEGKNSFLLS